MIRNGYFVGTAKGKKSYDDAIAFTSSTLGNYVIPFSDLYGFSYQSRSNFANNTIISFAGNLILTYTYSFRTNPLLSWSNTTITQWNSENNTLGNTYNDVFVIGPVSNSIYPVFGTSYGFIPAVSPTGDTIVCVKQTSNDGSMFPHAVKTSTWNVNTGVVSDYTTPSELTNLLTDNHSAACFNPTNDGIAFLHETNSNIRIYNWNSETGYGNVANSTISVAISAESFNWHPQGRNFAILRSFQTPADPGTYSVAFYNWNPANSSITLVQQVLGLGGYEYGNRLTFSPGGNAFIFSQEYTTYMYRYTPNVGINLNSTYTVPSNFVNRDVIKFIGFNKQGNVIFFLGSTITNLQQGPGTLYAYKWSDATGIGKLINKYNDFTVNASPLYAVCPRGKQQTLGPNPP